MRIVRGVRALILWDIDHTLVENNGVSKQTYAAAFTLVAGIEARWPARTEGRTDRLIMRQMFDDHDLTPPAWEVIEAALEHAGDEHAAAMQQQGSALPGVPEALAAIAGEGRYVQSVLTGNIRANAHMKLAAMGLERWFDFSVGAYGADSDDRAELVTAAQHRATAAYDEPFGRHNTVLIGDTPRDVDAGRRGGAAVIAVATGVHDTHILTAAGAAATLPNLVNTNAVRQAVDHLTQPTNPIEQAS
jgi:phosphoglycolate phosphatase